MANGFAVSVSLIDKVTGPLKAINKQLAASQAPYKRLAAEFNKFKELTGFNAAKKAFGSISDSIKSVIGGLTRMFPLIGTITGALSIAGMTKLVQNWGELGTKLLNVGAIIGTSATKLQSMQNSARLAGASADDMTSSLEGLGKAAQDALSGNNKDAANLFRMYGVNIQKSGFQAKSGAELMGDAFGIIKKLKDHGASAAVIQSAMSTLGLSSGLTRFAEQGAAGLDKYNQMVEHFGVLSPKAAEQADNMRFSFTQLQLAVEGFGNSVAEKLGPVLTPMIQHMAEWVVQNKDFIATKIAEYVKQISEWVKQIDFKQTFKDVKRWTKDVDDIVKAIGGWKLASEILIGVWVSAKALKMAAVILSMSRLLANPVVATLITSIGAGWFLRNQIDQELEEKDQAKQQAESEGMVPTNPGAPGYTGWKHPGTSEHYSSKEMADRYRKRNLMDSDLQKQVAQDSYNFYLGKHEPGFGPAQASAMVAMEKAESGFDPNAVGDSGKAKGLYQHHKERRDRILSGTGIDVWDTQTTANQHREAAWWELHHDYRKAFEKMKSVGDNPGLAGAVASEEFEQPKDRIGEAVRRSGLAIQYHESLSVPEVTTPSSPATNNEVPGKQSSLQRQQGNLHVVINAPPGWPVSARASGNVLASAPRIVQPMSSYAMG